MDTIKLSLENLLLNWAEMCIEWFMNLFADPEYYWVEENYPTKRKINSLQKDKNESIQEEKQTYQKHYLTGLKSLDNLVSKMIKNSAFYLASLYHIMIDLFQQMKWGKNCFNNIKLTIIKME